MKKALCVIPARMGSSRFPNKPMKPILGMPMIGHVALRCKLAEVFEDVVVATCDQEIQDYCESIDVKSVMTSTSHERASDRAQEACQILEKESGETYSFVTMVQGDEPMVTPTMLKLAAGSLEKSGAPVTNLRSRIKNFDEFHSLNCVKVVCNHAGDALYFSRAAIPDTSLEKEKLPTAYKQVCLISFERSFLDTFSALKPTYYEEIESIDMNRVLEHGYRVHCVETEEESYPVDVLDDLKRAESYLGKDALTEEYLNS